MYIDIGGGTTDITIIEVNPYEDIDNNKCYDFEVKAISGDNHLGGQDYVKLIYNYCINQMDDNILSKKEQQLLWKECEKAKCYLTNSNYACIEPFMDNWKTEITREKLEKLAKQLNGNLEKCIYKCIQLAKTEINKIDYVIKIGGSSRLPFIDKLLIKSLKISDKKKLLTVINAQTIVAHGAAIFGYLHVNPDIQININTVTPMNICMNTTNNGIRNVPSILIERCHSIPMDEVKKEFWTTIDGQTSMCIDIYEGNNTKTTKARDMFLIGRKMLDKVVKKKRGKNGVLLKISVDINGILSIYYEELMNKNNNGYVQVSNSRRDRTEQNPNNEQKFNEDNEIFTDDNTDGQNDNNNDDNSVNANSNNNEQRDKYSSDIVNEDNGNSKNNNITNKTDKNKKSRKRKLESKIDNQSMKKRRKN